MTSTRPRRSTRKPDLELAAPATPKRGKPTAAAELNLDHLLTNPKSKLTSIDFTKLFNAETWGLLSVETRTSLMNVLPPTAFTTFKHKIDPTHPSVANIDGTAMEVDEEPTQRSLDTLDLSFFTDPHFLAALRTFQDHLYSGWMTPAHKMDVDVYMQGIRDGKLHAPWKDQVWERDHREERAHEETLSSPSKSVAGSRAGDAKEIRIIDLLKSGAIQVGDILVYKRHFSLLHLTVEKDVMVTSYHPNSQSFEILLAPGTTQYLPQSVLLSPDPENVELPENQRLLTMTITTASSLDNGILDVDARVDKAHRPNGNAWKTLSVWKRRPNDEFDVFTERGPRENAGTLFYLRDCYYHDR